MKAIAVKNTSLNPYYTGILYTRAKLPTHYHSFTSHSVFITIEQPKLIRNIRV